MIFNFESFIFLIAGLVTGAITGIVGASAIVAFVPIILLFFNFDVFSLIGVSLAVDVFVSLAAMLTYRKYHHLDFKTGIFLSIFAIVGAIIGSYVSIFLPNESLLTVTSAVTAATGIGIFFRKKKTNSHSNKKFSFKNKLSWFAIILAFIVGFIGGSFGAAGGISLLLLFIFIFRFELHKAIGTSVFVMFFIALAGSITHFYYIKFSLELVIYAVIGGVCGSLFFSRIANYLKEDTLNKIAGIVLFVLGILIFLQKVIF